MAFNWFIAVDDHPIEPARRWQDRPPPETQDKITVGNASRVCDFTPADPATITA